MKVLHSWLKDYFGESLPEAEQVERLLTFHAFEIEGIEKEEGEAIIDVDVLPNRSSDCLSHRGIARELATIQDTKLEHDPLSEKPELPITDMISISTADKEAVPRFTASLINGVVVKESPDWLKKRLEVLGQRSINNIVDATNYVMLALGQPMHAYDADKFPKSDGVWKIGIRFARPSETISLLTEKGKEEVREIELQAEDLLVVDGSTDTPISLAGIKGGRFAELTADTKNIIIEAANFDASIVRKTARRLGIITDASKRFENRPARNLPPYAQAEIISLITDIAGGDLVGMADEYWSPNEPITTVVRVEKPNSLLGVNLSVDEMKNIIERTGASVDKIDANEIVITAPWERTDLNIEEDYIEEIGRIHGLSNIESIIPTPLPLSEVNPRYYYTEKIREALLKVGFSEVITSSFTKKDKIQLQNALASDKSYVRSSLVKNINKVLDANFVHCDLLGIDGVRVFEIGTVFDQLENSVGEHTALTLGVRTKGNGYNAKDDKVLEEGLKVVAEVLGVDLNWKIEKGVAEINLSAVIDNLVVPAAYEPVPSKPPVTFKTIIPYPAVSRDIALWVGEDEDSSEIENVIAESAGNLLVRSTLFDTFSKDGRKSYAFRLVFQSANRTLTDQEVNVIMEKVYNIAKERGWEVR